MPEAGLDENTSWRCALDNAKFCPAEGCPEHYGCARDHGWQPEMPSPDECRGVKSGQIDVIALGIRDLIKGDHW